MNRSVIWIVIIAVVLCGVAYWFYTSSKTATGSDVDQDLSAIDAEFGSFDSDAAAVSASMSDQPVEQPAY